MQRLSLRAGFGGRLAWFAGGLLRPRFGILFDSKPPGCVQGARENVFAGSGEANVGHSHAAPTSVDGQEDVGQFLDEGCLLLGRDHQISIAELGRSERGENAAADTEIGLAHVRALFGAFEAESDTAEIGYLHCVPPV